MYQYVASTLVRDGHVYLQLTGDPAVDADSDGDTGSTPSTASSTPRIIEVKLPTTVSVHYCSKKL